MNKPAHQPLVDLKTAVHKLVVEAMRQGMHVEDVALTLSTLATGIQYAGQLHREVTGADTWP